MRNTALDPRLMSAAGFVRRGAVLADIGTDHAYLPLFLLEEGIIERAVLADVNDGPLESARKNATDRGMIDRVTVVKSDGAEKLSGLGITDFAICGMGGELIADIVGAADCMRDGGVRLILQPMSRQAHLRTSLGKMGFRIIEERYSYADGKYYVCMLAEYTGECRDVSPEIAELGLVPSENGGRVEYLGYLMTKLRSIRTAIAGKEAGGLPTACDVLVASAIEDRIKQLKESQNDC